MYACMHACMYVCVHVCMYVCVHACMYACMYVCMYTLYMSTYIHVYIYLSIYLSIYLYRYIYIYTHTHTNTHTHTCYDLSIRSIRSSSSSNVMRLRVIGSRHLHVHMYVNSSLPAANSYDALAYMPMHTEAHEVTQSLCAFPCQAACCTRPHLSRVLPVSV